MNFGLFGIGPPEKTIANQARLYVPDDISDLPGLVQWCKADSLLDTLADDATVASWTDSSGSGHPFVTGGGAVKYRRNQLNGWPTLRFLGAQTLTASPTPLNSLTTLTVFVAWIPRAMAIGMLLQSGSDAFEIYNLSSLTPVSYVGNTGPALGPPVTKDIPVVSSVKLTGNVLTAYTNGMAGTPVAASGNTGTSAMNLGGGASFYSNCDVAEVIMFNNALSDPNRERVEQMLRTKYAI